MWASVIELAERQNAERLSGEIYSRSTSHVVLASRDTIFSDSAGNLTGPLAEEAATRGLSIELARDLQSWITRALPGRASELGVRDIAANARDYRLTTEMQSSDFFDLLEIDASAIGLPRSAGPVTVQEVKDFALERLQHRKLPPNQTLVEYRLDMQLELNVEMSQEDADANEWDYFQISNARRVSAELTVDVTCDLEAIYDAYDLDFEYGATNFRRIAPASVVDTGIGAPVEPWNVPLPIEVLGDAPPPAPRQ